MAFNATTVTADAFAVTPSDTTKITAFGLYVGSDGGNVVVTTALGTDVTFTAVPAGTIIPLAISKVKAATTSTAIVAFGPR